MPVFIIRIDQKAMSMLKGEGTEYYSPNLTNEEMIADVLASYPIDEIGRIDLNLITVMEVR